MISIFRLTRIFVNKLVTSSEAIKPVGLFVVMMSVNSFANLKEYVVGMNGIISTLRLLAIWYDGVRI